MPKSCEQCGAPLKPDLKFCEECGAPVVVEPHALPKTPPEKPAPAVATPPLVPEPAKDRPSFSLPRLVGTVTIIVILCIIALVVYSGFMTPQPDLGGEIHSSSTPIPTTKVTSTPVTTMAVPGDGSATDWYTRGTALYDSGDYSGALYAFEKATTLDPETANAWNAKSRALHKLGKNEEAIVNVNKAIAIDPVESIYENNKGIYLRALCLCMVL